MKRRKLLPAALIIVPVCFAVFYYFHHRSIPDIIRAIDHPVGPKFTRPTRKNAVRSEKAKQMNKKTDIGDAAAVKPYGCLKTSSFDEATGILRRELDFDCDGIADDCVNEELNEYGEPLRIEHYKDCGKAPGRCNEIEYNEYGEMTAYNYDKDCDGIVDVCGTLKRNDHGDIIEWSNDKGCDGVLEEGELHLCNSFIYDEDGLIVHEREGDCGAEPFACIDYEYDLVTGVRHAKGDNNCDGTVDVCQVQFYREGYSNPDSFIENNCDGTWKSCNILGEVDNVVQTIKGHEACAKKYDELVNKNLKKR